MAERDLLNGPSRHTPMMPVREVRERLDRLHAHGFIDGWREEKGWYWVDHPGGYRWYSRSQIGAWIDGANAMGAAP